ncbi:MAG: hypothetical protein WBA17_02435 [Saprospiraceae bacterium]
MKSHFLTAFAALLLTLLPCGCGSNDDNPDSPLTPGGRACTTEAFNTTLTATTNDLTSAASNYANNPTTATCEAYRASALRYLNAFRDFEDCPFVDQATFQQDIMEAQQELNDISC